MNVLKPAASVLLLLAVPALVFVAMLNRDIPLAPLVGYDSLCSKCNRPATRTVREAAEGLKTKGLFVYSHEKYPKRPPVWCQFHTPDKAPENAKAAYFSMLAAFGLVLTISKKVNWP